MNGRILIVEDEKDIAEVMVMYLKRENVETLWMETGEEALSLLSKEHFDLIVLDINLPGMDGYETLRKIRKSSDIPVIIVSARQEDVDMIMGFGTGADDYVTKPFSPGVLVARIRAHLRRQEESGSTKKDLICFGPWQLDCAHFILKRDGVVQNLSPREMDLLVFLTANRGSFYSQEDLYQKIWGNNYGDLSTVPVHIQRLRKKLETDPSNPSFIRTRYGYGYYFQGEEI